MLRNFILFFSCIIFNLFSQEGITLAESYKKNSRLQWDLAMKALESFSFDATDKILDVGCGDGKITAFISSHYPQNVIVGLDISDKMIAEATVQHNLNNLLFLKGNAEEIPFKNQFDKVVSFSALHWVPDQKKAFLSIKESLKDLGMLLVIVPEKSSNNVGILCEKMALSEKWASYFPLFKLERHYKNTNDYLQILKECGFSIVDLSIFEQQAHYKDRAALKAWIKPLLNFIDHLPAEKKEEFIEDVATQFLLLEPPTPEGDIIITYPTIKIIAQKN